MGAKRDNRSRIPCIDRHVWFRIGLTRPESSLISSESAVNYDDSHDRFLSLLMQMSAMVTIRIALDSKLTKDHGQAIIMNHPIC